MIHVDRGAEPQAVADQRARQLPIACDAFDRHGPAAKAFKHTLRDYDAGKRILYTRQHQKCAYCERKPGWHNQPLEHFRPKAQAWRHMPGEAPARIETGYWWLTWTWENQLFSCTTCNGKGTKANYFPLVDKTAPMPGPAQPCHGDMPVFDRSLESPKLLDPSDPSEHLLEHLRWIPDDPSQPHKLWRWRLHAPTPRGEATSLILHLHELEDEINDVYKSIIWPPLDALLTALRRPDKVAAHQQWASMHELIDRTQSFTAAMWWQLESLRGDLRRRFDIQLAAVPRP